MISGVGVPFSRRSGGEGQCTGQYFPPTSRKPGRYTRTEATEGRWGTILPPLEPAAGENVETWDDIL